MKLEECMSLFDNEFLSESMYENLSVIESCYEALSEGVDDQRVITTATTYTYSVIVEFIDSVKTTLVKLCSMILSVLNDYMLNHARYIDKYREILKDRVSKLKEPFTYSYYEYPVPKDYPYIISASNNIEPDIVKLQEKIRTENLVGEQVSNSVDNVLRHFGSITLGEQIDPFDLKQSVTEIVTRKVRGDITVIMLTAKDIDNFIKNFQQYKQHSDEIKRTRASIEKEYILLKKTYEKAIKAPMEVRSITRMELAMDPKLASFKIQEQNRFASIQMEMTRLFTGFIDIYHTAFNIKLKIIQERIDMNKSIIHELLMRTGLLAAVHTKNPDKNRKPYEYKPKI